MNIGEQWTSRTNSYFDMNYRGIFFWPIPILDSEYDIINWMYWMVLYQLVCSRLHVFVELQIQDNAIHCLSLVINIIILIQTCAWVETDVNYARHWQGKRIWKQCLCWVKEMCFQRIHVSKQSGSNMRPWHWVYQVCHISSLDGFRVQANIAVFL